jgi:hypothetical protein
MAITIDWGNRIIYVPKDFMTLIQSTPTEIRELNINTFRMALKNLEDDEEGMMFPDTHSHNAEVTVGGVTLAMVIEIINDYTITFEDGQYAVNLVGANSNIADRVNVNQVSVRSANSAGMTSSPAIEYSSFNGGVTIDVTSTNIGTVYPSGTPLQPVNNLADAKLIAAARGFRKLYIIEDITFQSGDDISHFIVEGESTLISTITLSSGALCDDSEFRNCRILGYLDGQTKIIECTIGDMSWVRGLISDSLLDGDLTLSGTEPVYLIDCESGFTDPPTVDMGGSGRSLIIRGHSGDITITNMTGENDYVVADFESGKLTIEETVTDGTIIVRGIVDIENQGEATIDITGTVTAGAVSFGVWEEAKTTHNTVGSFGKLIQEDLDFLIAVIKNKKLLTKVGSTWYLAIRNETDTDNALYKALKDKNGNDITDIQVGILAQELKSSV